MKSTLRYLSSLILLLSVCGVSHAKDSKHYVLYVGTYTNGESKGIYAYHYDATTGAMQPLGLAAETENPSFLAADAKGEHLFAVNETQKYQGESSGGVTAFTIDRKTGKLSQLNEVASHGHAHWIEASARNRFAYVSDLGLDRVLIYKFDAEKGVLSSGPVSANGGSADGKDFFSATLAPGTGPRHVTFSADGRFMYVLGELDATVTVFANDDKETYRSIQKISSLPASFSGENTAAEIAVHPNGKFLYTSNRGDDSIAEFSVDQSTGKVTLIGNVSTLGKSPRHFAIDPTGARLLAANQDTGNIVEYPIDTDTGKLSKPHEIAKVASAVCLLFVAVD